MNKQDTITIAEFGNFTIEAEYSYRIEVPYSNKHSPASTEDIRVEQIELVIKRHISKLNREANVRINTTQTVRTVRLLDIPAWLWTLLNDQEVLEELDRDTNRPDEPDREPEPKWNTPIPGYNRHEGEDEPVGE
jgi:hypothetical protein